MKKSLVLIAIFFFLFSALPLSAQTAAELDVLLETPILNKALASRFVLGAVQLLPEGLAGADAESTAFAIAQGNGWLKGNADDPIKLKEAALLIMKAFDLKGGLMYRMAKSPRYAYRELLYRKVIQGRSDPAMKLSGRRLLAIIDRAMLYSGEGAKLDEGLQLSGGGN